MLYPAQPIDFLLMRCAGIPARLPAARSRSRDRPTTHSTQFGSVATNLRRLLRIGVEVLHDDAIGAQRQVDTSPAFQGCFTPSIVV